MPASEFLGDTPRVGGLTHVIDKGMGPRAVEDFLETAGEYADIVKLGWGTAYVTNALDRKIEIYRAFGMPVVIGGTFFEVVYAIDKLDAYKRWLESLGLTHVELSDGTIEIPRERKLELIADFARDFTVLSEVGSKDPTVELTTDEWGTWMAEELGAGAWKVIAEARETGSSGIFREGKLDEGLITDLAHMLDVSGIIWEAPTKASQVFFLRDFYRDVNLGNIPPEEVIPLETLRRGLRGDTLKEILLRGERAGTS